MEITKENEEIIETVEIPNLIGITYSEAKKILEETGIGISTELESEAIITDQLPKAGIQVTEGTEILLYSE